MQPQRLKIIACCVLFRELSLCAAHSPHLIDVDFLHRSLHEEPDRLREELQRRVDQSSGNGYDALLLGYGLCSNGIANLVAQDTPLIIPKGHDCITLLLGSREAYNRTFWESPGTYYYTPGWLEREGLQKERMSVQGEEARQRKYQEYVTKYGEDNARYLMEVLHSWQKNYDRALFIEMGLVDMKEHKTQVRKVAQEYNWRYDETEGDLRLLRALVSGQWNPAEFLVVPPGARTAPSFDDGIITCVGPEAS